MTHANVRPLDDRMIVKLDPREKMVGGLHLPETAYVDANAMATVVAVGPGHPTDTGRVPLEVKAGDRVCVIRLHERTDTQERLRKALGDDTLLLEESDVVYVERNGFPVPLRDKIIVRPAKAPDATPGGIIIPDGAKEQALEGTVIAHGQGRLMLKSGVTVPMGVKVDDVVLYGKYAGTDVKIGGIEHLVLREDDVYGVLEKS